MFIVRVIPIRRGLQAETLTYFSAALLPPGTVIKVPLRKRLIAAIVLESVLAANIKSEVKTAAFALRSVGTSKIGEKAGGQLFLNPFMQTCAELAHYFVGTTGNVVAALVPAKILEQAATLKEPASMVVKKIADLPLPPLVLQADDSDRFAHYKSIIREEFARKRSVFVVLPTIQDGIRAFETLSKGIENNTLVANAAMTKKQLAEVWNRAVGEPHPLLIIATGAFLCLPRADLGTIIVEREAATGYKQQARPFVDIRRAAEILAKQLGIRLVLGDILLRAETLDRVNRDEAHELVPLKFRLLSSAAARLVDMKKYKILDRPEFRIISDELETLVRENREHNERLFLFCARRGLAPTTVCGDCGATVLCSRCRAPIVLHRSGGGDEAEQFFLCHRCGERRSAAERCSICDSWNLTTLGIGITLVAEALTGLFPDLNVFQLDSDSIANRREARERVEHFYNSPGSVLLGTELAVAYLDKPVENVAVASADALFSIPDFRIGEEVTNLLLRLRSLAQKQFLIQSRSGAQPAFKAAQSGNAADFHRDELAERERLGYPPSTTLIKITAEGDRAEVEKEMFALARHLQNYKPIMFPAFVEFARGKFRMHLLLALPRGTWPGGKLHAELAALPPTLSVNIDPESLL